MILIPSAYSNFGGSHVVLFKSAEALRKSGFSVHVRTFDEGSESKPSIHLKSEWQTSRVAVILVLFAGFFREIFFILKLKPDFVYVHDKLSLYLYGGIAKLLGIKVVWHVHFDMGCGLLKKIKFFVSDFRVYISDQVLDCSDTDSVLIRNPVKDGGGAKVRLDPDRVLKFYYPATICRRKRNTLAIRMSKELRRLGVRHKIFLCGDVIDKSYFEELLSCEVYDVEFVGKLRLTEIMSKADALLSFSSYESHGLLFTDAVSHGTAFFALKLPAFDEISSLIDYPGKFVSYSSVEQMAQGVSVHAGYQVPDSVRQKMLDIFSAHEFEMGLKSIFDGLYRESKTSILN